MVTVRIVWLVLALIWLTAEIRLARANRPGDESVTGSERGSQRRLWFGILAGLGLALAVKNQQWLPIPVAYLPRQLLAMLIFAGGLALRYSAVRRLGRFFTTHVIIHHQHRLIGDGPYRRLRHPAYTGLLVALAGAGLAMGDVVAWLLLMVPSFLAFKARIDIEENMLQQAFGAVYRDYCKTRWKLLPWLF